ncbi:MAG: sodium:proton antiporter [Phycisphaerales bacterium JB065]
MTLLLGICVAVIFAVSVYLLLSRELKSVAMGVFLFSHAAHLGILAMSGQPVLPGGIVKGAPVLGASSSGVHVDPLPQALILTSIVISFAIMAFLLTLLVTTFRTTRTLNVDRLSDEDRPQSMSEPIAHEVAA